MSLNINEIFYSIQGEGVLSGAPTIFIRTTGCNLRCRWCDTEYAFFQGKKMEIEDAVGKVRKTSEKTGCKRVCLTGGEPLLQRDVPQLIRELLKEDYHLSVETNGSLPLSSILEGLRAGERKRLLISMDIKCPSSGEEGKMRFHNILMLTPHDQIKFVILDTNDLNYATKIIQEYNIPCPIILQPVFSGDISMQNISLLVEEFLKIPFKEKDVRFMLQLHKIIWKNKRGV